MSPPYYAILVTNHFIRSKLFGSVRSECIPLDQHTTNSMRSNKRRNTKPELLVRRGLREAGFPGYRIEWKVPGKPDICYPGKRVAIFINGCFWHRCPVCNPSMPKHNREFWENKFSQNVERDINNQNALREMGWTVIVVWECEIKKDLDGVVERIVKTLEANSV